MEAAPFGGAGERLAGRCEVSAKLKDPDLRGLDEGGARRGWDPAGRLGGRATLVAVRGASHLFEEEGALPKVSRLAAELLAEVL